MVLENFFQNLIPWFFSQGLKIIGILVVAWIVNRIVRIFIYRIVRSIIKKSTKFLKNGQIKEQRAKTLVKVFRSIFSVVIWTIAILMIIPELGISPTPLLAGAGLVGLAIGMGARSLIQDYLSGLFILIEDQYRVGEEIEIVGIKGKVKELSLRQTILKDSEGIIHYISNGQITKASNRSRAKLVSKK